MFVVADDGVKLYAEIEDVKRATATVVMSHGFLGSSDVWRLPRQALPDNVRIVVWDQRGHGRSETGSTAHVTMEVLGDDLRAVIEQTALAHRPVFVVGHSMGAISILFLNSLLGTVVTGVLLCSSSAGDLHTVTAGLPYWPAKLAHVTMPYLLQVFVGKRWWVEPARSILSTPFLLLLHRYLFASAFVSFGELVRDLSAIRSTQLARQLWDALHDYSAYERLSVLRRVTTWVVVGEDDLITPVDHSRRIIEAVPTARLMVVPRAGHMVITEAPETMGACVSDFIKECLSTRISKAVV